MGRLRLGDAVHPLHSLAVPYALDALGPAEARRFERHLAGCARCAEEVRALAADLVRLARAATVPAPPDLRRRILAAVRTTAQEPPVPRAAPEPPRRPSGRGLLALA
ncbi:RskA family anti-sigma factor, partial [Streptomyces longispororuber]|uniref:RskA family anti-sigma factor n=1 Tax=Streptomyces longispororuber TaxID=68230 RepID=UPI00167DB51D